MPKPPAEQLRDFGHQENRHVLACIFNPDASSHDHLEYVEETAAKACGKAERAFGAADPIHIEALINIGLFHTQRTRNLAAAEAALKRAAELLRGREQNLPELAAEVLAGIVLAGVLCERGDSPLSLCRRLAEAFRDPRGVNANLRCEKVAVAICQRMASTALDSPHPVTPFLVAEAIRALALDLAIAGHRDLAGNLLRETLQPLLKRVWGAHSPRVAAAARDADLLTAAAVSPETRTRYDLSRLAFDLESANVAVTTGHGRAKRIYRSAAQAAKRFAKIPPVEQESLVAEAILQFESVAQKLGELAEGGDVKAKRFLSPALTSLAVLYRARAGLVGTDDQERAVSMLRQLLETAEVVSESARERARVILAELYHFRLAGDPEDNVNQVLVWTDSLDLKKETDPYYWALGKFLRGAAYVRRRESKYSASGSVDYQALMMDIASSVPFLKEAVELFDHLGAHRERGQALLYWFEAMAPMLHENVSRDVAESMTHQLGAAESALTPESDPEAWTRIQLGLARISALPLKRDDDQDETDEVDDLDDEHDDAPSLFDYFGVAPLALLSQAQAFMTWEAHPQQWARLEQEKAQLMAASPAPEDRLWADAAFTRCLEVSTNPDSPERFTLLRQLGAIRFDDGHFAEALPTLEEAFRLGERLFNRSLSMHARRVTLLEQEGISRDLSYCYFRTDRLDEAVVALDRGKCRLLRDILNARTASSRSSQPEVAEITVNLYREIRALESESYGGMGSIENMERLIAARGELDEIACRLEADLGLSMLAKIPNDTAIIMPLTTSHGTVVYLLTSGLEAMTAQHVLPLPRVTSDVVQRWMFDASDNGWFPAYRERNESYESEERFKETIEHIASVLWHELLQPVCARLKPLGIREIVFVPTGALHFLPLHAARCIDPNGERHLVDDFVVRIAPSAGILAMLQAEQARLDLGAVVAGVSQYKNPGLAPLPGVEAETRAIAETLGAKPLLNEAANAETLAGALREAAFVHLACHGAQWAEDPQFGKHFAPQAVLHLANEGLTFADILVNWDLGRTRLITLSACDTGLIDAAKPWDELEGLRHVLLQSGAQAIVASLWSVDDESTALLMRRFYRNIRDREMAIPEALSESQRWLRDATHAELAASHVGIYNLNSGAAPDERPYRHPYFWGPFFFTG